MQSEQQIIARWVQAILADRNWSLAELASRAKVNPTTIGRAADPDWKSVTSVKTIAAIAAGAGVKSPLDVMSVDSVGAERAGRTPSAETLAVLLAAVLPLAPKGRATAQSLRVVASALAHGLELLGDPSATVDDERALGVAARGAVARLRDLTRQ